MSKEEKKRLPLSEMINYVSQEIQKANESARSKPGKKVMRFVECEVELAFELELEVGGKVNLWAVELGTKGVQIATHTLKVKYHAISDDRPLLDGDLVGELLDEKTLDRFNA